MSTEKPIKPTDLLPRSFATNETAVKADFSESLKKTGYEANTYAVLGGANLNYYIDGVGKELEYVETIVDYINAIKNGYTPIVNSNGVLDETTIGVRLYSKDDTYDKNVVVINPNSTTTAYFYISLQNGNKGNSLTDANYWQGLSLAKDKQNTLKFSYNTDTQDLEL